MQTPQASNNGFKWYAKVNNRWVDALPHQVEAVKKYEFTKNNHQSVPHPKGGMFTVTFDDLEYNNHDGSIFTRYFTEYGGKQDMLYATPSKVAHIHRVIDVYGGSKRKSHKSHKSRKSRKSRSRINKKNMKRRTRK